MIEIARTRFEPERRHAMGGIKRLIAGVKRGFGLHHPGRSLRILADDVFLVSYPKSGNTWARFLLANLLHPDQSVTFANLRYLVPDFDGGGTKRDFDRMPRPRIIKSHACFDPRYPRVIYIVRDPRDVALSQYHYCRKRRKIEDDFPIECFVAQFVTGETWDNASWGQNVLTWVATREGDQRFLLLRYEDMIADTGHELKKVAAFLGLHVTDEQIARAVERSSAGQMRKMEQAQSEKSGLMKGSRKDLSFVRVASAGGWRSQLPPALVARIEAAWEPIMRHLGYELTTRDANSVEGFPHLRPTRTARARV
jgi:hypothetical protein